MRLPPYSEYKPSGIEWLGEVPEHWVTWKATHGFRRIGSGTTPKSDDSEYYDGNIPWVTTSELRETVITNTTKKVTATAMHEYPMLRTYPKGTLLFAMYGATIGRLGILGVVATVNQACAALAEPLHLDTWFVYYWLQMRRTILIVLSAGGGQPNLSQDDLRRLRIPAPQLDEQRAIADFLDRETAKIDTLVAKKGTLTERLKEKRTALISRTVTRGLPPNDARAAGLDPHPKLKPTGIDWLGEVPEHWEVKHLMQLTDQARPIMYGIVLPGPDVPDGVPIVKGGDVKPGRLTLVSLCRTTVEIEAGYIRSRLAAGDVVFSIRGTIGEAELVPKEIAGANLTQDAARVAPSSTTHGPWLLYALKAKAIVNPLLSLSLGAAVRGVNIRDLKRIALVAPPLSEQRAIAAFLDRETVKIDVLVAKIETAIERLQEYRTALITAAVTGKIDVREAAA